MKTNISHSAEHKMNESFAVATIHQPNSSIPDRGKDCSKPHCVAQSARRYLMYPFAPSLSVEMPGNTSPLHSFLLYPSSGILPSGALCEFRFKACPRRCFGTAHRSTCSPRSGNRPFLFSVFFHSKIPTRFCPPQKIRTRNIGYASLLAA